jgi:hypothetical protein
MVILMDTRTHEDTSIHPSINQCIYIYTHTQITHLAGATAAARNQAAAHRKGIRLEVPLVRRRRRLGYGIPGGRIEPAGHLDNGSRLSAQVGRGGCEPSNPGRNIRNCFGSVGLLVLGNAGHAEKQGGKELEWAKDANTDLSKAPYEAKPALPSPVSRPVSSLPPLLLQGEISSRF